MCPFYVESKEYEYILRFDIKNNNEILFTNNEKVIITQPFGKLLLDFLSLDIDKMENILLKYGCFIDNYGYLSYRLNKEKSIDLINNTIKTLTQDIKNNFSCRLLVISDLVNYDLLKLTDADYGNIYEYDYESNEVVPLDIVRLKIDSIYTHFFNEYKKTYNFIEKYITDDFYHDINFYNLLIHQDLFSSPYDSLYDSFIHIQDDIEVLKETYINNICVDNQYTYYIRNIQDVYDLSLYHIVNSDVKINRCVNCGNLFYPQTRNDEIYCNNIFKNRKTCKQLGYEIKANQDEILKPYRTIYKTQNARKQRNKHKPNIDERFSQWSEYAHSVLKQCQDGEITVDEMKELISSTEWLSDNEV